MSLEHGRGFFFCFWSGGSSLWQIQYCYWLVMLFPMHWDGKLATIGSHVHSWFYLLCVTPKLLPEHAYETCIIASCWKWYTFKNHVKWGARNDLMLVCRLICCVFMWVLEIGSYGGKESLLVPMCIMFESCSLVSCVNPNTWYKWVSSSTLLQHSTMRFGIWVDVVDMY